MPPRRAAGAGAGLILTPSAAGLNPSLMPRVRVASKRSAGNSLADDGRDQLVLGFWSPADDGSASPTIDKDPPDAAKGLNLVRDFVAFATRTTWGDGHVSAPWAVGLGLSSFWTSDLNQKKLLCRARSHFEGKIQ